MLSRLRNCHITLIYGHGLWRKHCHLRVVLWSRLLELLQISGILASSEHHRLEGTTDLIPWDAMAALQGHCNEFSDAGASFSGAIEQDLLLSQGFPSCS